MSYFLDGAVNNHDSISLIDSNNQLLLRTSTGVYYFDNSSISTSGLSPSAIVCTFEVIVTKYAESNTTSSFDIVSFKLKDNTTGKYVMVDSSGGIISSLSADDDSTILEWTVEQQTYQRWNKPTAFLAGVGYFNVTPSNLHGYDIGKKSIILGNIYFIPVAVYQRDNCNKATTYSVPLVDHWCENTNNTTGVCANIPDAWTNQNECNLGVTYNYCPVGNHCSTQCKAPCSSSGDSCNWNVNAQVFQCDSIFGISGSWYTSIWFIVLTCLVVAICIVSLVFWLIFRNNVPKNQKNIIDPEGGFEKETIVD